MAKDKAKDEKEPKTELEQIYGVPFDLSEEEQEKIVKYLCDEIGDAVTARSDKESKWNELNAYYDGIRDEKTNPWENSANVALGFAAETVDALTERSMSKFDAPQGVWEIKGLDDFSAENEDQIEEFLNDKFVNEIRGLEIADNVFHDAFKLGTPCVSVTFERDEKRVRKWVKNKNPLTMLFKKHKQVEESEVRKEAKLVVHDHEDVFVSKGAGDDIDEIPMIGVFHYPTYDELASQKNRYQNVEKLKGKEKDQRKINDQDKDSRENLSDQAKKGLKVATVQCLYDINEDGNRKECVFTIEYDNKVYLRGSFNPYFHNRRFTIPFRPIPKTNRFYGGSVMDTVMPINKECEAINNRTLDNWDICSNKMVIYQKGAGIHPDQGKAFPGRWLGVPDINLVKPLELGDINMSSLPLLRTMMQFLQLRSGVPGYMAGASDPADPRASGKKAMVLMSQGEARIETFFKRMSISWERVAMLIIALYAQHGDEKIKYNMWDNEKGEFVEKTIDREILIKSKLRFKLNGLSGETSNAQERSDYLFLYEVLMKSPLLTTPIQQFSLLSDSQLQSMIEVTEKLFHKYKFYNLYKLLPTLESLKRDIRSYVMAELEMQMKQAAAQVLQANNAMPVEAGGQPTMGQPTGGQPNA